MQYKLISNNVEWLPDEGLLMWKENIKGKPSMPKGDPVPSQPREMEKPKGQYQWYLMIH